MVSDDNPGDEGKKGNLEGDAGIQLGFLRHFITPIPKIPGDFPSNIVKYTYKYVKKPNNELKNQGIFNQGDFSTKRGIFMPKSPFWQQNPLYKKALLF